jgi:type 1 glutamine amidotransferase
MALPKTHLPILVLTLVALLGAARADDAPKPIEALMITGGGFHDYAQQQHIIADGVSARANVHWTIFFENGDTKHELSIYDRPNFGKGFDVIVHNECYADVTDPAFIAKVLAPHRAGIPGVVIHCTLHTFRAAKVDDWREFIGMSSNHHNAQMPIKCEVAAPTSPILAGFPAHWVTGPEELYSIDKIWPNATVLVQALAYNVPPADVKEDPVIWTNLYLGQTRVFGTSLAHNDATMRDPVYLDLLTRGLLWACHKLGPDGNPLPGYGPKK